MLSKGITDTVKLEPEVLKGMLVFANGVASLCTTKKGAIPSMPDLASVKKLIEE